MSGSETLRSRIRFTRLWAEAAAGLMQRPARSFLTSLGTVLGVGSFVAVLGLTATANGQIQNQFNSQTASQVTVRLAQNGQWGVNGPQFPPNADTDVLRIRGVTAAGVTWGVSGTQLISASARAPGIGSAPSSQFTVVAASPGLWAISKPKMVSGRVFDSALASARVAVIGSDVAKSLGITSITGNNAIFVDGITFTVIGIFSASSGLSTPTSSITIPATAAEHYFGSPDINATMLVQAQLGATQVVAPQLAYAIDPRFPGNYTVVPPPNSRTLQDQVSQSVQNLALMLAGLFMLIGAVGIANNSFTALLTRIPEIALKRSLGALPRHVGFQFMIEFALIGAFGGTFGSFLGTGAVLTVALAAHWTAIIAPWVLVVAPFLGAIIGLLASVYSAIRATRIEPVEAFRR